MQRSGNESSRYPEPGVHIKPRWRMFRQRMCFSTNCFLQEEMADEISAAARIFCELAARLRSPSLDNSNTPVLPATENRSTTSATTTSTRTQENISSSPSTTAVSASTSRSYSELQTLFPHHFTSTSRTVNADRNRSNSKKRKRMGTNTSKSKTKSLTRKFVCLADKEQLEVPDREEQRNLLVAGLGEVKVAIPEDSNENNVRDLLIETFPKLKEIGGFELMYVESRSKDLLVIPPGPDGTSIKYLASFIGQGKIYIRPIQQDLPLNEDSSPVTTRQEECRNCHAMIDLVCLRDHHELCTQDKEGRLAHSL